MNIYKPFWHSGESETIRFHQLSFKLEKDCENSLQTIRYRVLRRFGESLDEYQQRVKASLRWYLFQPSTDEDYSPTGKWFQSRLELRYSKRNEWIATIGFTLDC